ncbi:myosin light chain kinase, smooth muscle-like [Acipenser ruthenus]|uniref:myosin light chain kinase, smooth muscle-like n=1 Tax=Acipenser ruthenus TaxID=7906 RepID=UPI002740C880|nr:myosin light chain kinase, smooth muscle-like [Acipenser ruthenus]
MLNILSFTTHTVKTIDRQSISSTEKAIKETVTSQTISEARVESPVISKQTETYSEEFRSVEEPSYEYSCQVFESVSERSTVKKTTTVKRMEAQQEDTFVKHSETIAPRGPTVLQKLCDLRVNTGAVAQFICSFDGQPYAEVVWDHNGKTLPESERMKCSQSGGVLSISILNVQLGDQGWYRCAVKNTFGEARTSAQLTVEGVYEFFVTTMDYFISSSFIASCVQLLILSSGLT